MSSSEAPPPPVPPAVKRAVARLAAPRPVVGPSSPAIVALNVPRELRGVTVFVVGTAQCGGPPRATSARLEVRSSSAPPPGLDPIQAHVTRLSAEVTSGSVGWLYLGTALLPEDGEQLELVMRLPDPLDTIALEAAELTVVPASSGPTMLVHELAELFGREKQEGV